MGRGLSIGIQYLCKHGQLFGQQRDTKIPNCMQLIFQLGCSRPLLNEVPNNLYLSLCTRLKTFRVMENKVASFICNLMLNIMYTSLTISWNQ